MAVKACPTGRRTDTARNAPGKLHHVEYVTRAGKYLIRHHFEAKLNASEWTGRKRGGGGQHGAGEENMNMVEGLCG